MTICVSTYVSLDAPDAHRWIACLFDGAKWLPLVFNGDSEEAAAARAQGWLTEERAKEARRHAASEARSAARKNARGAKQNQEAAE